MDISNEIKKYMYLNIEELNIHNLIMKMMIYDDIQDIPIIYTIPNINKLLLLIHPDKINLTFLNLTIDELNIFEDCVKIILTDKLCINMALQLLSNKINEDNFKIITDKLNYHFPYKLSCNESYIFNSANDLDLYYNLRKTHELFYQNIFDSINNFISLIHYNFYNNLFKLLNIKEIIELILLQNDNDKLINLSNKILNIPIIYNNIKDIVIYNSLITYELKEKITKELIDFYKNQKD